MSYYHHLFEAYVDRDTRSVNVEGKRNSESVGQIFAGDRLQQKIRNGTTLVRVTVKNVNKEYWKDARKEANPS